MLCVGNQRLKQIPLEEINFTKNTTTKDSIKQQRFNKFALSNTNKNSFDENDKAKLQPRHIMKFEITVNKALMRLEIDISLYKIIMIDFNCDELDATTRVESGVSTIDAQAQESEWKRRE